MLTSTALIEPSHFDFSTEELEVITAIEESIKDFGLFHPILIRVDERKSREKYFLVTGRKRLQAIRNLKRESIEATVLEFEDPDKISEVALNENLRRSNLQWYDQVELEQDLHNLRFKQHGNIEKKGRPRVDGLGWSQNDTARELGISLGAFSQDMQLAAALAKNPHLRRVKDKTTALKLVREAAAREANETASLLTSDDFKMNQVFLGDSSDILAQLPKEVFDVCITDPPWINYSKDESLTKDDRTLDVFKEVFRVLNPNAMLYAVVSTPDFFVYRTELPKFGYKVQDYPIIWAKSGTITHGRRPWEYARDYEPILVAGKGNPVLAIGRELSSILSFPVVPSARLIHPHEKPVDLISTILTHCSFIGGRILDPFAGSGVVGESCKKMGREYILIEREQKFFKGIERRLK